MIDYTWTFQSRVGATPYLPPHGRLQPRGSLVLTAAGYGLYVTRKDRG